MNILYIHQYFKTPDIPGGTRSYWNSLELIKNGHTVTVIRYDQTITNKVERKTIQGINIISLNIKYSQYMGVLSRLQAFLSFMVKSTLIGLREKNIDLVIATSTPLTVGFPALVLNKMKGIPYIFEVRDLWPEVPIQMGALNNKLVIKLARWFERTIYKNASHIIALSPGMKKGVIETGINEDKVAMIPNMAKIDKFYIREHHLETAEKFKINGDTFKIIYFGALGEANAIEYILEGAELLKNHHDIEFLFIGYGPKEAIILNAIEEKGLKNVTHLGVFNMEITSEIVNMCQVSLVTFGNLPILATNSPNKLFDSLSAGKPILVNSPGWTKDLVETQECGLYVDPNSPKDLADKIIFLKNNPELLQQMGANSRKLAETKYDKSILCREFSSVVDNVQRMIEK